MPDLPTLANIAQVVSVVWLLFFGSKTIFDVRNSFLKRQGSQSPLTFMKHPAYLIGVCITIICIITLLIFRTTLTGETSIATSDNNHLTASTSYPTARPLQLKTVYSGSLNTSTGSTYLLTIYVDSEDQKGNIIGRVESSYYSSNAICHFTGAVHPNATFTMACQDDYGKTERYNGHINPDGTLEGLIKDSSNIVTRATWSASEDSYSQPAPPPTTDIPKLKTVYSGYLNTSAGVTYSLTIYLDSQDHKGNIIGRVESSYYTINAICHFKGAVHLDTTFVTICGDDNGSTDQYSGHIDPDKHLEGLIKDSSNAAIRATWSASEDSQAQVAPPPVSGYPKLKTVYSGYLNTSAGATYSLTIYLDSQDHKGNISGKVESAFYSGGSTCRFSGIIDSDTSLNVNCQDDSGKIDHYSGYANPDGTLEGIIKDPSNTTTSATWKAS